jgi:hypothetical protein
LEYLDSSVQKDPIPLQPGIRSISTWSVADDRVPCEESSRHRLSSSTKDVDIAAL